MKKALNFKDLWINSKTKQYYCQGNSCCDICQEKITNRFVLQEDWSRRKKPEFNRICLNCLPKIPTISEVQERKMFLCVGKLPTNTIPYFPSKPFLVESKPGANWNGEIIDNTKLAGKPGCTFQIPASETRDRIPMNEIHDPEAKEQLTKRTAELEAPATDEFINVLVTAKPIIEETKRKRIEND